MNDIIEAETEAQRETRLRHARTRRALLYAPEVVRELCLLVFPTDGRTERGEAVTEARIPIMGHVLDDVNELYGALVEGVGEFAQPLGENASDAGRFARWQTRNVEGHVIASVYGLPDRFTPQIAEQLTRRITTWLLPLIEKLEDVPGGREWLDDVVRLVWRFRHQYRLTAAYMRVSAPRPCPRCGQPVSVTFFGGPLPTAELRGDLYVAPGAEDRLVPDLPGLNPKSVTARKQLDVLEGVQVSCNGAEGCGWSPPATPEQIGRWIA